MEIDQKKAEKIICRQFPEYLQNARFFLEKGMNLILTAYGIIPTDKRTEFIRDLGFKKSEYGQLEALPINFDVYNNDDKWLSVDSQKSLYAVKKYHEREWFKELHLQVKVIERGQIQSLIRLLYFEEP